MPGGKALALAIEDQLCDTGVARRIKRLPGAEPWLTLKVHDQYVLFRFPTPADRPRQPVGTRIVARVVDQATLLGAGAPPAPDLVMQLVTWRIR